MPLHGADEEGDEPRLQFFRLLIPPHPTGRSNAKYHKSGDSFEALYRTVS